MTHQKQNDFEDRVRRFGKSTFVNTAFVSACKNGKMVEFHHPDYVCMSRKMYEELRKSKEEAIREARIPESRISQLRQWINEKPKDRLVTNEDIKVWLEL